MSRSARQLTRYLFRFATDSQYRNMVIGVLNEHLGRSTKEEADRTSATADQFSWARGKTVYLVGGCELEYMRDQLESFGMKCKYSFELATAQDPFGEISNPQSPLHSEPFDYIVFSQYQLMVAAVQAVQLIDEATPERGEQILMQLDGQLRRSLTSLRESTPTPVFIYGYPLKYRPWRGRLESSRQGAVTLRELLLLFELQNRRIAADFADVFVLEPGIVFEEHRYSDALGFVDADGLNDHVTREGSRAFATELLTQATINQPQTSKIKAVIFDLDNTLWDGTLAEDGVAGLSINPFRINAALAWASRGILLCICSKNDPESLADIQTFLPKEFVDAVALWKVSWAPKPHLVREIADTLNLGLPNIAFFDDLPFEREAVAELCKGIHTYDATEVVENLTSIEFEPAVGVTGGTVRQDWQRAEERRREVQDSENESYEEFLMKADIRMAVRPATERDVDRVTEVISRTNQLNATGVRLDRAEVANRLKNESYLVAVVELRDAFGDFGLIGVLVAAKKASSWEIEILAFSCRAMGRKVEVTTLNVFLKWAEHAGAESVSIEYRPTSRNSGMRMILEEAGLVASHDDSDSDVVFSVSDFASVPGNSALWLNLDAQELLHGEAVRLTRG